MRCIIYSPHWLQTTLSHIAKMGELYTYIIRGAFGVARFDNPGNAKALTRGTSDRTGSTFLICVYSTIFIISHIGVWWHLIIADMEYCLNYIFKGKHYTTKYFLPLKASTNQLEAIAQGLALTSAEQNNHKSYGRYTDMNLFEDGILVWHSDVQIILENYSCNL